MNNAKVMCNKTLGQIGYEAYCSSTGWKSLISGAQLPQWADVKPEIQLAWETAGGQMVYAAHGQVQMLTDLIGKPPEGSHPDEWQPRDSTWHGERRNWIAETDKLRRHIEATNKGIGDARQAAMDLCWQIEKSGASEELTKCSVMASELQSKLNDLLP